MKLYKAAPPGVALLCLLALLLLPDVEMDYAQ